MATHTPISAQVELNRRRLDQYTERKGLTRRDAINRLLNLYGPHCDQAAVDAEVDPVVDPELSSARRKELSQKKLSE